MTRRAVLILTGVVLVFALAGCREKAQDTAGQDGGVGVVNPMVEVRDDDAFDKLGVEMDVPDMAKDIKYYIIDDTLAHIDFTYQNVKYIYRGGEPMENMAGLHGMEAASEETAAYGDADDRVEVAIRTMEGGGYAASWTEEGKEYSLVSLDETNEETFKMVAAELAD